MQKAIIVAYDTNRAIGRGGDLPWGRSLPADLAHFKRLTRGGDIIMGRKTFESIGSRPLPERENIVISSRPTGVKGVLTAVNLSSALALSRYPTFIIGGAQVYGDALGVPEIDTIYATEVDATSPDADTFFPELDMTVWEETDRVHRPADEANVYALDFVIYRRKAAQ
ncbi:dihydrofolate reductase [Candidatus Nanosynbacter sp. BB002]|jgi:dihydrofolate reductase|uniref:dihydrofolate reductase n=1 Tax=Candidatus Nanosynbacter sp. BB002 TaxID=3393757 RepID=UPI0030D52DCC